MKAIWQHTDITNGNSIAHCVENYCPINCIVLSVLQAFYNNWLRITPYHCTNILLRQERRYLQQLVLFCLLTTTLHLMLDDICFYSHLKSGNNAGKVLYSIAVKQNFSLESNVKMANCSSSLSLWILSQIQSLFLS